MVNVWIDTVTPCLINSQTENLVNTEAIRIAQKNILSKYNTKKHWYINWASLLNENDIFALRVKGKTEFEGLIALQYNDDFQAVYITWMCSAPHNNKELVENPKYKGVGGHLFAIAVEKSIEHGYDGAVTGNAADLKLLKHYCNTFNAIHIGALHPYQFFISETDAQPIREVYSYEWSYGNKS